MKNGHLPQAGAVFLLPRSGKNIPPAFNNQEYDRATRFRQNQMHDIQNRRPELSQTAARKSTNNDLSPEESETQLAPEQDRYARFQSEILAARRRQQAATGENSIQGATKKAARTAIKRGINYLANLIATAITAGTGGLAIIATGFVYLFSLGYLNVEMFWYYKEGKKTGSALNYLIEPLDSWDPLPISTKMIPITILHLGILVLDFIVFILGVVIFLAVFMMVILPYAAPLLFVTNSAFRSAVSGVIANYIGL